MRAPLRRLVAASLLALPPLMACPAPKTAADAGPARLPVGTFPSGFMWGTAVAGFQVEAGCPTVSADICEDRHSDWYHFVTSPTLRVDPNTHLAGQDISASPGFYELYPQDVVRADQELHNNALRFGLEWSRIFAQPTFGVTDFAALRAMANPQALQFYHDLLTALSAHGLKPLVTVNHYTLPDWIHDAEGCHANLDACTERGWLDDRLVPEIAKFAGFVGQEFGAQVDLWATQNEPLAVVLPGYLFPSETRTNPPAVSFRLAQARQVMANMQVGHARMYDALKAADVQDVDNDGVAARIGLVFAVAPVLPMHPDSLADQAVVQDVNYLYNTAYLNGTIRGDFDPELDGTWEHREDMAGRMDWIGVNYYTRVVVEASSDGQPVFPEFSPLTTFNPLTVDQGPDYAHGMYDAIKLVQSYNLPIIVTENGAADPDDNGRGTQFMVEHLTYLSHAISEGAPVQGYFWWSLMDNFEWNHGMTIRMGLYAVSATDPAKIRTARQSVATYGRIAQGNALPADLMASHPVPSP